jgi:hypothetical protein
VHPASSASARPSGGTPAAARRSRYTRFLAVSARVDAE